MNKDRAYRNRQLAWKNLHVCPSSTGPMKTLFGVDTLHAAEPPYSVNNGPVMNIVKHHRQVEESFIKIGRNIANLYCS